MPGREGGGGGGEETATVLQTAGLTDQGGVRFYTKEALKLKTSLTPFEAFQVSS